MGSPTRAFRPTPAISKLLAGLAGQALAGVKVAAFDTRIDLSDIGSAVLRSFVRLFGYAAGPIAKRLAKKGGELVVPPEGFSVAGTEGPLKEGDLERAADWARRILARL